MFSSDTVVFVRAGSVTEDTSVYFLQCLEFVFHVHCFLSCFSFIIFGII